MIVLCGYQPDILSDNMLATIFSIATLQAENLVYLALEDCHLGPLRTKVFHKLLSGECPSLVHLNLNSNPLREKGIH